jgi:integrase
LQTGGRYSSLARLKVRDFHEDSDTITLRTYKGDGSEKSFSVTLTAEGVRFFKQVCVGKKPTDLIFTRANGAPWGTGDQQYRMSEACARAGIEPIGINALRHTWASLSVMAGVPLLIVAKNLGHSSTKMVEAHYSHLSESYVKQAIREHAPTFGFKLDKKVVPLG